MKVDSGGSGNIARAPAGVTLTTMGSIGQSLWIDSGEVFFSSAAGRGSSDTITAGYHDFRIEIGGLSVGSSVDLYIDGVLEISDTLFNSAPNFGTAPRIVWGDLSTIASGQSTWTYFEHDAAIDQIPEPAGFGFVTLALAVLGTKWKRARLGKSG